MNFTRITHTPLTKTLAKKARILDLAGDPTRIRILCLMYRNQSLCVSQIAESLGVSVACASHHLQLLKDENLVNTSRMGNNICYKLVRNESINTLEKLICK